MSECNFTRTPKLYFLEEETVQQENSLLRERVCSINTIWILQSWVSTSCSVIVEWIRPGRVLNWKIEEMTLRSRSHHVICHLHHTFHAFMREKVMLIIGPLSFKARTMWRVCRKQVDTVSKFHTRNKTAFCWHGHEAVGVLMINGRHSSV